MGIAKRFQLSYQNCRHFKLKVIGSDTAAKVLISCLFKYDVSYNFVQQLSRFQRNSAWCNGWASFCTL